jgi:hypothetical protein
MHPSGRILGLLVLASTLVLPSLATADPPSKCAAAKMAASSIRTLRVAKCDAKAIRKALPVSSACLGASATKLDAAFTKAEQHDTDCLTTDDASPMEVTTAGFVAGLVAALPFDDTTPSRRCSARKVLASAKRAAKFLRCDAKGMRHGEPPDEACLAKAVAKFERQVASAERPGACVDAGDASTLATAADGFAAAVGTALGLPVSLTTTSTTTSSSTSTTSTTGTTVPGQTTTSSLATTTSSSTSTTIPAIVSFSAHVQPILTANCAVPGCHTGVVPQQDLDLSAGQAYASLVGVPSSECPLFPRVQPDAPASSYLMFKLEGPPQPCLVGNQMPAGGAAPLSAGDQSLIAAWIAQGALDN